MLITEVASLEMPTFSNAEHQKFLFNYEEISHLPPKPAPFISHS